MIVYSRPTALRFDGGHVEVGAHADFDLASAFSFAAWVRPTTESALQATLLSKHYTAYEPQVQNGRLVFERGPEYPGTTPVQMDRWVHLAVTFDAGAGDGNMRLYVNGELDTAYTLAAPLTVTTHPLLLGKRPGWDDGLFRGWMAEVALWSTALSGWRLKQEMNSRPNSAAPDLVAWWSMDEGEGEQVGDRSPRGHHGTIRGAVRWEALEEPITIGGSSTRPLEAGGAPPQLPENPIALRSAPRAVLPPSGRNGAARRFLDRVSLHAQQRIAAAREDGSSRLQQAKESADDHVAAAHEEAVRRMNSTRFDALWFLYRRGVHRADARGTLTPFRTGMSQQPVTPLVGEARVGAEPALAECLAVDAERGRIFWALPHPPFSIFAAAADGSGDDRVLVRSHPTPVAALALDTVEERVFYLTGDGRLCRVPFAGGEPEVVLEAGGVPGPFAWDLAFDADRKRLYWTGPGGVWSATPDGLGASIVVPPHEAPAPVGVAVDGEAGRLYWLDAELRRVRHAALDGSGAEDLYEVEHPVRGLALDEVTPDSGLPQEVYWSAREERITRRTPGIVGYWPLDEGDGRTIRNRVRPAVHSHLGGFRRSGDDLPPPLTAPSRAVALREPGDFLRLPQRYAERLVNRSFTIRMWVKPRATAAEQGLLYFGEGAPGKGLHLLIRDGKPYLGFYGNDTAGTVPLVADRWTHLAFRYDLAAQEQAIFVDGVLEVAAAGKPPLAADPARALWIGRYLHEDTSFFTGSLVGLDIAERALTPAEIAASALDPRPADVLEEVEDDPAWIDSDAPPMAARPEAVLAFGGTGYVKLGQARGLGFTASSFTVECWLRPDRTEGDLAVLGTDARQNSNGLALLVREGKPYLAFFGDDLAGTSALGAGEWVHLAWRFDAETREQSILVNGVVDARRTARAAFAGEGMVYLGRALVGKRLVGAVSELRIWTSARTDAEISRNLRGYRERFVMRGPVGGAAEPEHLFEIPSEGGLALVSRLSADHERRLIAYRDRKAAQAKAAADVAAAHAESDALSASKQAELEKAHRESQAAIESKKASHEQDRAAARTRLAGAQTAATQRVENAKQDAARNRATAHAQAEQVKQKSAADAAAMKDRAQAERDRARAERDRHR